MVNEPHIKYVGQTFLPSFDYNVDLHLSYIYEYLCCSPMPRRLISLMLASAAQSSSLVLVTSLSSPLYSIVLDPDTIDVSRPP